MKHGGMTVHEMLKGQHAPYEDGMGMVIVTHYAQDAQGEGNAEKDEGAFVVGMDDIVDAIAVLVKAAVEHGKGKPPVCLFEIFYVFGMDFFGCI